MSDIHRATISMFGQRKHAEVVHVKVHDESLLTGAADLLAEGERNAFCGSGAGLWAWLASHADV